MEKWLWLDMEMSGLEVEKERIIEVAVIITDKNFNELETFESVIFQDQKIIDQMDDWNKNQHGQSGLIAKIPTAPKMDWVESQICALVKKHFISERPILCGNSISQDRKFIDRYMTNLAALLHYRLLDVTSWKIIMSDRYKVTHEKKESHRALDDIRESIAEMKTYLGFIDKLKTT